MVALITDPALEERVIAQRKAAGADRFDEVWDGVYVLAPLANNEHQHLVNELCTILTITVAWTGLGKVFPGVNVTDQDEDWQYNYRCPDIVVYVKGTQAESRDTHWFGGPDFGIEVVSPHDRTLEKLPFYAKVGTRELLVVDRRPWKLTLFRLGGNEMVEAGSSTPDDDNVLASQVVPLSFRLMAGEEPPVIEVIHKDGVQRWLVKSREE